MSRAAGFLASSDNQAAPACASGVLVNVFENKSMEPR